MRFVLILLVCVFLGCLLGACQTGPCGPTMPNIVWKFPVAVEQPVQSIPGPRMVPITTYATQTLTAPAAPRLPAGYSAPGCP